MTDNDRLRKELGHIVVDHYVPDYILDELQSLIAREVRLGKIEELKKAIEIVYGMETSQMAIDDIEERIAELEKETVQ